MAYLHNSECTLALLEVDIDLEVCAWFDWLRVEVPRDCRLWVATEHDLHDDSVSIVNALISERQREARRLLLVVRHFKRHLETHQQSAMNVTQPQNTLVFIYLIIVFPNFLCVVRL